MAVEIEGEESLTDKMCANCAKYTNNMVGTCVKKLCDADMKDDRINWFMRKEPDAPCHRPDDFEMKE